MQQILNVWNTLEPRKRILVVLATIAMFATVLTMSRMASQPSLTLLYAGLESSAAGDVVSALEQRGVAYDVRGGSIFVESSKRDELRMTLASEGLPANSGRGYELLDSLSGFGTTSQMFDAAYWRAKEGELARTIAGTPNVMSARVHIAHNGSNPFQREVRPTASVSVTTSGGTLSGSQARALKYLVASAVAGLTPDDVAIIDGQGGLISAAEDSAPNAGVDDRAETLRDRVQRLLEARVGFGNAVVEVSVDTVTETESFRERRFDPQGRVAISTDTEENTNSATGGAGGDVTVASNLPNGDAGSGDTSSSQNSQTRERVNYEVSETERQVTKAPGSIKRLSVAVLVNGLTQVTDGGETQFQPRTEEELASFRELVSSAVGFDETRGDVITIKSMQFEPLTVPGTAATAGFMDKIHLDIMSIIQMAVLAIVALILGLFVVRPILGKPAPAGMAELPPPPRPDAGDTSPLNGEIDDGNFDLPEMSVISDLPALGDSAMGDFGMGSVSSDPVDRLRNLISERQDETVEILRNWLEDSEENA
ncbi:MAG: flagellar basal-body MS-ring/collar protein FliF [Paracoccaceae bacterium]